MSGETPEPGSDLYVRSATGEVTSHRDDADLAAAQQRQRTERAAARENRWVIVTRFDDGKRGYVGENRRGYGLTHFPGNAYRYPTEAAAQAEIPDFGYDGFDFRAEQLPPKPRLKQ